MTVIDPTSSLGKIRLRTGDWNDIVILPDVVIQSALDDCSNNVPRAAALCAQYILATLTGSTHRKLQSIEVWGKERFDNYLKFIQLTILNPNIAAIAPIPYSASGTEPHEIVQFISDWRKNYAITQSQTLAHDASISPNDGSLYGVLGNGSGTGWDLA